MNEKVSIIIPAFNAENTIEKCIISILEGSYKNVEVIIINDCSIDHTLQICEKIQSCDDRVTIFSNSENLGVSKTRNIGLKNMNGKYVMFVDSDDWVEKDYVSLHMCAMQNNTVMLAISGYINEDLCDTGLSEKFGFNQKEIIKKEDFSDVAIDIYHGRLLQQLWNKIFISDVIRSYCIRFDDSISIGEDFRFILSYISQCSNRAIVKIKGYPYHYMRINKNSLMYNVGKDKVDESINNLHWFYELVGMSSNEVDDLIEKQRDEVIRNYAYLIMHNAGMSFLKKRRLIISLSSENGCKLFHENFLLYLKERIKRQIIGFFYRS